jgi:predicted MPP superfamily phosphohydrolase
MGGMNKAVVWLLALLAGVVVSCSTPRGTGLPTKDFTIVALPDTQFYSRDFPQIFQAQTDWIIANRTNQNIVYVAHLGDLVNDGDKKPQQWPAVTNALYRLESPALTGLAEGIPYGVVPGNHDHLGGIKNYNTWFGPHHFAGRKYYGGHLGTNNQNHYDRFSTGGMDFVVVYLDFNAANPDVDYAALDKWSREVLQANASRRALVVTHDLLAVTGDWDVHGRAIYNNLRDCTNVFLMLSGHNHGEARRTDTFAGHTIQTCLSDFQSYTNGGDGFLRLYQFSPGHSVIRVKTYSPWLDQFQTNAASQFEIPYTMSVPAAPLAGQPELFTSPVAARE